MARLGVPLGGRVRKLAFFLSISSGGFLLSRIGGHNLGSLITRIQKRTTMLENMAYRHKKADWIGRY